MHHSKFGCRLAASAHFPPIQSVLPADPCLLRPESGPEAERGASNHARRTANLFASGQAIKVVKVCPSWSKPLTPICQLNQCRRWCVRSGKTEKRNFKFYLASPSTLARPAAAEGGSQYLEAGVAWPARRGATIKLAPCHCPTTTRPRLRLMRSKLEVGRQQRRLDPSEDS